MNNIAIIVTLIGLVGLGGLLTTATWARIVLWTLSLPTLCLGIIFGVNGGAGEPAPPRVLWTACAITFWPFIGCTIGELIKYWRPWHYGAAFFFWVAFLVGALVVLAIELKTLI
jgi:hypothetical protein